MHKPSIIHSVTLPANNNSPVILNPCIESFHNPAPSVSSEHSAILRLLPYTIPSVWCNEVNVVLRLQDGIMRITVVGAVSNEASWSCFRKPLCNRLFHQGDFAWRSTGYMDGDRKRANIRNCHDFTAFSAFGRTNTQPPFLALANVPSIKHSSSVKSPRRSRSSASIRSASSNTPRATHSWYRRCAVRYEPYFSGNSLHCAPVFKIHSTPSKTFRSSTRFRPRGSSELGRLNREAIASHCIAVKYIQTR